MARTVKSQAAKKLSAATRKAKTKAKAAPKRVRAVAEKGKSKFVKTARRTLSNARKAETSVRRLKKKISHKLRKPNAKIVLSSEWKNLNAHFQILKKDILKLGRQTINSQMKSIKEAGRALRKITKK